MAVLAACVLIIALHLAAMMLFNHVLPDAETKEMHGPLYVRNYLVPTLLFAVPTIVFLAGLAFAVGEWTRRPILVFVLPVVLVLIDGFFLWDWSPNWLDPRINNLMMWIDPAGFRWLNETWLKVDRGVSFYNNEPIPLGSRVSDQPFCSGRAWVCRGDLDAVSFRRDTSRSDLSPRGSPGRRAASRGDHRRQTRSRVPWLRWA